MYTMQRFEMCQPIKLKMVESIEEVMAPKCGKQKRREKRLLIRKSQK